MFCIICPAIVGATTYVRGGRREWDISEAEVLEVTESDSEETNSLALPAHRLKPSSINFISFHFISSSQFG
jgi:hypothetical protein